MSETIKYEEAYAELEAIVSKMEDGQLDIDQIATHMKRAQQLIKFCKQRLTQTEQEIEKLNSSEA